MGVLGIRKTDLKTEILKLKSLNSKFKKVKDKEVKMFDGIHLCKKCNSAMIRAAMYDPDGTIPFYGGIRDENGVPLWVCNNPGCEDGGQNTGTFFGGYNSGVIEAFVA